jgi:hypothetical protein
MKCIFQETLFHALQEWTCPPPQDIAQRRARGQENDTSAHRGCAYDEPRAESGPEQAPSGNRQHRAAGHGKRDRGGVNDEKESTGLHRMGVNLRHKPSAVSLQRFKGKEPLEIECKHRRKAGSEQQKRDPSAPSNVAARCRALMTDHHEPPPGTPGSTLFQEDFPADLFPAGSPNPVVWF